MVICQHGLDTDHQHACVSHQDHRGDPGARGPAGVTAGDHARGGRGWQRYAGPGETCHGCLKGCHQPSQGWAGDNQQ